MVRKSSKSIFRAGVFIAAFFVCLTSARAQTWKQIGNLPYVTDLRCAYFWDTAHGVVGGVGYMFNYNDGVWSQGRYPEGFDTIKSLRWLDGYNLYAASGATCIWKSSDHGVTWQRTSALFPNADDVFLDNSGIDAINLNGIRMMRGTSFVKINPISDTFEVARDDDTSMLFSWFDGIIWSSSGPPYFPSGYNCVADTCSRICYSISDGPDAILYRTTDKGETWGPIYDFGDNAIDVLDGADLGVMYVQGAHNVWRSLSGGVSWENIGGPGSNLDDRRMFAFGQYNRYLIVMNGNKVYLWDGGTGYVPTGPIPKVLSVTNVVDTDCTFPQLTVHLNLLDHPDTVVLHAYTMDGSTIQPSDTTIILPAGTGFVPVQFRTSVPPFQFTTAFYFEDTISGIYGCGQFRYSEDTFMVVQMPSYPKNILSVSNVTDTACSISNLTIYLAMTKNPDTVRLHAYTNDGLLIQPADTMLIVPAGYGWDSVQYQASAHPFQFASSFHFEDTVSGQYKCGRYKYVTDSSIVVHLFPPPGRAHSWLNNPIKLTACANYRIPLVVRAPNICDSLQIDSITLFDNSLSPQFDHQPPETLGPDGIDTFWVTVSTPTPGIFNNYFYVHAYSTVFPRPYDTALFLSADAIPSHLNPQVTAPTKLSLSNCAESIVPFYLHSLSCDSVEFTACTLTLNSTINYSTNLTFPLDLPPGVNDTVLIYIPPQSLSQTYAIYARLEGIYLGSSLTFDITVQILVSFKSSGNELISNSDEFSMDTVSACSSGDTTVTFTNWGCTPITVIGDQTSWKPGWSADDPTFPFALAADSSFTVTIHFHPSAPATSYQGVAYGFKNNGGTSGTSTALTITAVAIAVPATLSISNSALDFGTFSLCDSVADVDTTITITNTGCDSLSLRGASVDAGAGFSLVNGNDTTLGPNASARYTIHFADSISATLASRLHIHAVGAHGGNTIDTTISLSALVVAGTSRVAISTNAIDFGTTLICEERDSSLTIANTGCDTITIYSGDFSSLQFAFADTVHFPIVLPPNSTATFPIFTHLDTMGHLATITSTLNFTSDSGVVIPAVTISRSVTYPGNFSLALKAEASAPISAGVPIYVTRNGTVPSEANEVDFDLVYNEDILGYRNALEPDIKFTGQTKLANGLTERSFVMNPASDRDTIATLQFLSYLSKNDSTTLGLAHQQFLASGVVSPSCVATMDTSSIPSNFHLELVCSDSLILAAMNEEPPFSIISIQPNPAQSEILICCRVSGLGFSDLKFELENLLGQTVLTQHSALSTQHSTEVTQHLDVSSLPGGIYFLRLSQNGFIQSRQVVIER